MANYKPGTRQYYEFQKACAEAAAEREINRIYQERLKELRAEAQKQGFRESEFTLWLDQPAGVVPGETELAYYQDEHGQPQQITQSGRIVSRRQALNLELRALKADLMAREGFDADPFL